MATVAATRTIHKVYYAVLFDDKGQLTKVGEALVFVSDADAITVVEPDMCNFLTVLGEVQMADAQRIRDLMYGGFAAIACARQMQVA